MALRKMFPAWRSGGDVTSPDSSISSSGGCTDLGLKVQVYENACGCCGDEEVSDGGGGICSFASENAF